MATEAQITANRRNALKSTGPRTEKGKQTSARNAVKHGLNSRKFAPKDLVDPRLVDLQYESLLTKAPELTNDEQETLRAYAYNLCLLRRLRILGLNMLERYSNPRFAFRVQISPTALDKISRIEANADQELNRIREQNPRLFGRTRTHFTTNPKSQKNGTHQTQFEPEETQ